MDVLTPDMHGMPSTIAEAWGLFSEAFIPGAAPPVQKTAMELAFFHGASSVIAMMVDRTGTGMPQKAEQDWCDLLVAEACRFMIGQTF